MNFDDIKAKMDAENMDDNQLPTRIKDLEASKMPIQRVRKSMIGEIITQLLIIVFFFAAPSFIKMHILPQSIYYILMFVISLITLGYLMKMNWFLNKTSNLSKNSKATIKEFIYDLKLTLEVYKTATISGSLLLPLPVTALLFGTTDKNEAIFTDLLLLHVSPTTIIFYIIGYLIIAILIYIITIAWVNKLYGVHIKALEETLKEFEAE